MLGGKRSAIIYAAQKSITVIDGASYIDMNKFEAELRKSSLEDLKNKAEEYSRKLDEEDEDKTDRRVFLFASKESDAKQKEKAAKIAGDFYDKNFSGYDNVTSPPSPSYAGIDVLNSPFFGKKANKSKPEKSFREKSWNKLVTVINKLSHNGLLNDQAIATLQKKSDYFKSEQVMNLIRNIKSENNNTIPAKAFIDGLDKLANAIPQFNFPPQGQP